jgi:hypothetical protein
MRRLFTAAVAALALVAWPTLAISEGHGGGRGGHAPGGGGGHSGGGHSGGGHSGGGHAGGGYSGGGHSGGGYSGGSHGGGGHAGGWGHAVPRGSYGGGYNHAYYGHGYHGSGNYGHGYYGRGYYGRGYYGRGYYGYGYGSGWGPYVSVGFGWPYYGYYDAVPNYYGGYSYPDYTAPADSYYADPGDSSPGSAGAYYGGANAQQDACELRFEVQPLDAVIYVDGRFLGTGRDVSTMRLPEGSHRVEVVRPGFRTYTRDVDVRPDRPTELPITLEQ